MDVENLDALNPTELDELLERALNPRVPVEVLYAVLDRIGPAKDGAPKAATAAAAVAAGAAATAPSTADVEETTVMAPLVTQLQAQVHQLPQPHPHPQPQQPTRGAATDRAVRPERPNQKGSNPQPAKPSQQSKAGQQAPNPGQQQPKTASPAAHPSRGAHAPTRRSPSPPPTESGK